MCGLANPQTNAQLMNTLYTQRTAAAKDPTGVDAQWLGNTEQFVQSKIGADYVAPGTAAPGQTPDATDAAVRAKRAATASMLLSGRGRSSTMPGTSSAVAPMMGSPTLGKSLLGS